MPAVAVSDIFEDEGSVAGDGVLLAVFDGGFDGEDVHAIDFEAGNVLPAFVVFCHRSRTICGSSHPVFVVWCQSQILEGKERGEREQANSLSQPNKIGRFQSFAMLKLDKV